MLLSREGSRPFSAQFLPFAGYFLGASNCSGNGGVFGGQKVIKRVTGENAAVFQVLDELFKGDAIQDKSKPSNLPYFFKEDNQASKKTQKFKESPFSDPFLVPKLRLTFLKTPTLGSSKCIPF